MRFSLLFNVGKHKQEVDKIVRYVKGGELMNCTLSALSSFLPAPKFLSRTFAMFKAVTT